MSDEQERKRAVRQFEEALLAPYNGKGSVPAHELVAQVKEVGRLYAENERLRALVKAGERAMGNWATDGFCPWCGATRSTMSEPKWSEPHASDCPAFTPEGVVK